MSPVRSEEAELNTTDVIKERIVPFGTKSTPRSLTLLAGLVAAGLAALAFAGAAHADFGIESAEAGVYQEDGETPVTQAGAIPFEGATAFKLNRTSEVREVGPFKTTVYEVDRHLKDTDVDLPAGLIGNPQATPQCPRKEILNVNDSTPCPASTQVGYFLLESDGKPGSSKTIAPVYNMVPREGQVAEFAFVLIGFGQVRLIPSIRTDGDYGLRVVVANATQQLAIFGTTLSFWGVPAAHTHDKLRDCAGAFALCEGPFGKETPSGAAPKAFLRMPTTCDGSVQNTYITVSSWAPEPSTDQAVVGSPPVTGCDKLSFPASAEVTDETHDAARPSGLGVTIKIPQNDTPEGLATAQLRDVKLELPQGMKVNAAAAEGLEGCSPQQIALHAEGPANCPDGSKIGTVQIETPVLDHPLPGSVYLAQQGSNPFNSLLALYLAVEDPRTGLNIKLPGKVTPDPKTGQLTATFDENPQLPFETLKVNLNGGARAPLVNPSDCGTYTTHYTLTSWGGQEASGQSSFQVNGDCNTGHFNPGFEAGATNPVGGSYSPFTLRVTRNDGERNLSTIQAKLPEGELAKLAGVPVCGESYVAANECPGDSKVGSATVGVGAGPDPVFLPQQGKAPTAVYLAGPYKGAPYSLVVQVPAQAGPFDLGTVAVRTKLEVDPVTAQVTATSDPMPQMLQGIPVEYRDVRINIDRDEFMVNPTSCEQMSVLASLGGAGGGNVTPSSRFQVGDCSSLAFKPTVKLMLRGQTKRTGHPSLKAAVIFPQAGEANIGRAQVNLPHSEFLDQGHIKTVCTRVQFAEGDGNGSACPKDSIYGHARVWTPLLDKPLEGYVYLRSSDHQLPDLVAALDGQIKIALDGKVDSGPNKGIRNTFEFVPDAPVSRFVLWMAGGKKGLLVNSEPLCQAKTKRRAIVRFTGQNGKVDAFKPKVANQCRKHRTKKAKRTNHRKVTKQQRKLSRRAGEEKPKGQG